MLLENIKSPEDVKKLSKSQLELLADECRKTIIDVVGKNGGHLASNLGVVELTIALHRVFDSPNDAIIWDVSHQCYTHKLLTGRYNEFATLRTKDGISGFTNKAESPHDFFIHGHSSTSISSALGLLTANKLSNKNGKVVAVIGDGALTGGMAFEALSHAGLLSENLIVVLNDNQMSIDHNTGAVSRYLSRLTVTSHYQVFRNFIDKTIGKIPYLGRFMNNFIFRIKRAIKGMILTNNLFVDLGFEYTGPLDGHDINGLVKAFNSVSKIHRPVVVHVVTKKGKGYSPAENNPELFHGVGPFQTSDGSVEKFDTESFTEAFGNVIVEEAYKNQKICAITAAMSKGTGLTSFSHKFPERFFDVGIAEEHAVTFAGGLAEGGMIPVVCIYSTFMQRSVDQIIHDVSIQKSHVVMMLDRAGAVPNDGITHQGVFDIALFRPIPDIMILGPVSAADLKLCFKWAIDENKPVIIRYPKNSCPAEIDSFTVPVEIGKGIFISNENLISENSKNKQNKKTVLLVITGGLYPEAKKVVNSLYSDGIFVDLYVLRFIKPIDEDYFLYLASKYDGVVFAEDGLIQGGIGEYLSGMLAKNKITNTIVLGFGDKYYPQGNRDEILDMANLSSESIKNAVKSLYE